MLLLLCFFLLLAFYRRRIAKFLHSAYKKTSKAIGFLSVLNYIGALLTVAFLIFLFEGYGCYINDLIICIIVAVCHWYMWDNILN